MISSDLPFIAEQSTFQLWGFVDPEAGEDLIGMGTLSVSQQYSKYTANRPHLYIHVLSVKPGIQSFGYGTAIVNHLVAEAAVHYSRSNRRALSDHLFLDVYAANTPACKLYTQKCQFLCLNPDTPIPDPDESNEAYFVMARRISIE